MSAAQLASLSIMTAKPFIENSDFWKRQGKKGVEKIRRKSTTRTYEQDPDAIERENKVVRNSKSERRGKSDRATSRPRGGYMRAAGAGAAGAAAGAYAAHRSKSVGAYSDSEGSDSEDYYKQRGRRGGRSERRQRESRNDDNYDSEGSIPPRNRGVVARRANTSNGEVAPYTNPPPAYASEYGTGARSFATRSENDRDSETDSGTNTDEILDSEEDERLEKKKRRAELLTGGIAAVATMHAAANVYNSMKARETRAKQLADGTITLEDAKKQRYKHHLQDAATIGLAALSIKGAYGKWQGTMGKHRETKNHRQERKERQQKRIKKGISRKNWEHEREAAARLGRKAPGYEETARQYANGGGNAERGEEGQQEQQQLQQQQQPQRPSYGRQYSRSMDNLRDAYQDGYGGYGRSYGRGRPSRGYNESYYPPEDDMARYNTRDA